MQDLINKIHNADCLEFMKQLPDKSIDLVLTDIPYDGVNRESNGLRNLDKGNADILDFDINTLLEQLFRITKGTMYIFCGFGQISQIYNCFVFNKLSSRLLIWEKTNPSPMNGEYIWLSGVEPCIFGKFSGATFNGHCLNTVLKHPVYSGVSIHPTHKPLSLFKQLVNISRNENDLILDCFSGSGTTAIACSELKRNFICIEKDKQYYEASVQRLENYNKQLKLF
jgi:DNA modification methylase